MLDTETKRRIDTARDILVGKVPDPKSQVEQITIALIYKFMDDMDAEAEELGGKRKFFSGDFSKYGWTKLMSPAMGGHEVLNLYAEAITRMTENEGIPALFRDIFKNAFLPYRDPETLKSFLKIINDFEYDHSERLGDAFEYLLSVLGSQGDAGQFRTPRHIIDFMVEVIDPKKNESILDPACGTAGFLISSWKHVLQANSKNGRKGAGLTPDQRKRLTKNIIGYDISPDMVRLSLVNLYLHGFTDPHISEYDTLTSEDNWNQYSDIILANPPFMSPKGGIKPHKRFSVQAKRSEVLFVDYIAEHLTPGGRAAVIVPEGIIFQSQNAYKQLRKMLVENYLYAVVSLPAGIFQPYSGVKTSILLMDKNLAKKSDSILFVKIENDGFDLGAQRREIEKNDLPQALQILKQFHREAHKGKEDGLGANALIVKKEKIAENGEWNLSGERYRENDELRNTNYELVALGKVCETTSGGTPLKAKVEYYKEGTVPWLRSGEVAQGLVKKSELFITEEGLKNSSAKLFPIDTVLIAMYGATAGQVGLLKFESTTNQAICGVLPCSDYIQEFIFQILKSKKKDMIRIAGGGVQPNISQKLIKQIKIPLPPLKIQQEIVAEIEGYQKIIDGARAVVENYKPKIQIDPDWKMVKLGDVCERFQYGSSKKSLLTGETPCLRMGNIQDGEIKWDNLKFAPPDEEYDKYLLNKNDVLFNRTNSPELVGKTAIYRGERKAVFAGYLIRIIYNKDTILGEYLNYSLNTSVAMSFCQRVKTDGVSQSNINAKLLSAFSIPLPPLKTQKQRVAQTKQEQSLVNANKELISLFEQKIKDKIDSVWGVDAVANEEVST